MGDRYDATPLMLQAQLTETQPWSTGNMPTPTCCTSILNVDQLDSAYMDAGACRTDQHTVLWRIDEDLLGQDEPVFKLHYSRQGNLKLTGVF